jgi:SpoVK/Ycf46/Vps4 family AAA+-type ATPase
MGVQVHPPKPVTKPQPAETDTSKNVDNKKKSEGSGALDVSNSTDWGVLAGYEGQKRQIEDCLLLPLLRPDVYSSLAKSTRAKPGSNRPRAVLFEGPPGTGEAWGRG